MKKFQIKIGKSPMDNIYRVYQLPNEKILRSIFHENIIDPYTPKCVQCIAKIKNKKLYSDIIEREVWNIFYYEEFKNNPGYVEQVKISTTLLTKDILKVSNYIRFDND